MGFLLLFARHMCFELMGGRLASAPAMLGELSRNNRVLGRKGGDDVCL